MVRNRNAHFEIPFADHSSSSFPKVANMRDAKEPADDVLSAIGGTD
jgi:hypothetical protein